MPEETASGHSLWLVPEVACAVRFAGVIDGLSEAWGTPRFPPHVTLLGSLVWSEGETLLASERLAPELDPVDLRFREMGGGCQFFRAFYVRVEPQPDLLRAHASAAAGFGRRPDAEYFPHLSLAYGELGDPQREAARASLERDFGTCRVAHLDVVRTTGPVESWETLARFPLVTGG